jgi:hypothetical protein
MNKLSEFPTEVGTVLLCQTGGYDWPLCTA